MSNETTHREIIEVDFATEKGKAKLAELQQAADMMLKLFSQPIPAFQWGGGMPGVPGAAPGGAGGGGTVSSAAVVAQQQASQAAQAAAGGVGGPAGAGGGQSATVSSGQAVPPPAPAPMPSPTQPPPVPTPTPNQPPGPPSPWPARFNTPMDPWASSAIRMSFSAAGGGGSGAVAQGIGGMAAAALGGPLGIAAAAGGALVASSLGAMDEANSKRALIESEMGMAELSGMLGGWSPLFPNRADVPGEGDANKLVNNILSYGGDLGIGPDKIVGGTRDYLTAAGGTFGPGMRMSRASPWIDAMNAGISPGTMGAIDSQILLHGAQGDHLSGMRLAGAGSQGFGMTGGLDRWMQQLVAQMDRLTSRGIEVNMSSVAHFLERMAADPTLKHLGGKAPAVVGSLGGVAADARSQLLAPFQQVSNAAVMMEAFGEGRDYRQAIEYMETMGPGGVLRATKKLAGEMGPEALAAVAPLRMGESRALLGMPDEGRRWDRPRVPDDQWRGRAKLEADKEWDTATWKAGTLAEHAESVRSSRSRAAMGDSAAKGFTNMMDTLNQLLGGDSVLVKEIRGLSTKLDNFP